MGGFPTEDKPMVTIRTTGRPFRDLDGHLFEISSVAG
jgi:hypothetical protein